ncbi:hypothetical protein EXIGLDRAFT_804918 [Exidia glandulosa HHB12029]|uniref:Retrotransposon gag domain-containing protein n=1 Tax=Exidia glandulosa HHB12029 TaxID=1314781 RepID=A0A165DS40_EXIGL|nr:hypothetical protein EXIGLDRAFT_804918 [Exidia glandulosa HHB12029]
MSLIFDPNDPTIPAWARQLKQRTVQAESNVHALQAQNALLQHDLAQAQQVAAAAQQAAGVAQQAASAVQQSATQHMQQTQPVTQQPVAPAQARNQYSKPSEFDGTGELEAQEFITKAQLYIDNNTDSLSSEHKQITWAASYLTGGAFGWALPYVAAEDPLVPESVSWTRFKAVFLATYGPANMQAAAASRLLALSQRGRKVQDYVAEVHRIQMYLPASDRD